MTEGLRGVSGLENAGSSLTKVRPPTAAPSHLAVRWDLTEAHWRLSMTTMRNTGIDASRSMFASGSFRCRVHVSTTPEDRFLPFSTQRQIVRALTGGLAT